MREARNAPHASTLSSSTFSARPSKIIYIGFFPWLPKVWQRQRQNLGHNRYLRMYNIKAEIMCRVSGSVNTGIELAQERFASSFIFAFYSVKEFFRCSFPKAMSIFRSEIFKGKRKRTEKMSKLCYILWTASSYRINTLDPLCLWQCFILKTLFLGQFLTDFFLTELGSTSCFCFLCSHVMCTYLCLCSWIASGVGVGAYVFMPWLLRDGASPLPPPPSLPPPEKPSQSFRHLPTSVLFPCPLFFYLNPT